MQHIAARKRTRCLRDAIKKTRRLVRSSEYRCVARHAGTGTNGDGTWACGTRCVRRCFARMPLDTTRGKSLDLRSYVGSIRMHAFSAAVRLYGGA